MKKFLLTLILCFIAQCCFAYTYDVDGIYYQLLYKNNWVEVSNGPNGFKYTDNIKVPSTIVSPYDHKTYTVVGVGSRAFEGCSELIKVELPETVTYINDRAFSGCSKLMSINIPENVDAISIRAFQGCTNMKSFVLPSKVKRILNSAFDGCLDMNTINMPDSLEVIADYAFNNCPKLTSITLPNTLTSIYRDAFNGCESLSKVYAPDLDFWMNLNFGNKKANPLSNGADLYLNDKILENLTIPSNLTEIKSCAFSGWKGYTVDLSNVTTIGDYAFSDCSNLTTVDLSNVTTIGESAFENCNGFTEIVIPESVNSLGYTVFNGCSNLKKLQILAPIPVEQSTIYGISNLEDLTLNCEIVEESLMYGNKSLKNLVLLNNVVKIEANAFAYCDNLNMLEIPESLVSIGRYAFTQSYSNLMLVKSFAYYPPDILSNVFSNSTYNEGILMVPEESVDYYKDASGWRNFKNIIGFNAGVEPPVIMPESITVTPKIVALEVGDEIQLEVTAEPYNATIPNLYYTSSNNMVATVYDEGLVKCVGVGEAVITVETKFDDTTLSATCIIVGTANSGVDTILADPASRFDVFSISGQLIKKNCTPDELKNMNHSVYIITDGKQHYKVAI